MGALRVLIVDDSVVFRSQIKTALEKTPGIEIVGAASNGKIAIEKLSQAAVDLITLDLEMPEMNGLQTIQEIKKRGFNCKIIVFSSQTQRGADSALEALRSGANDVVAKPVGEQASIGGALDQIKSDLVPKVLQFVGVSKVDSTPPPTTFTAAVPPPKISTPIFERMNLELMKPSVIVIGSSTGGPDALEKIFNGFNQPVGCPILLAQHMPPVFTQSLAKRLGRISGMESGEGVQWEILKPNRIYVAPGDFHMTVTKQNGELRIRLDQGPKRCSVRPAVDNLFESVAEVFGNKCAGFILTGMGEDGLQGAKAIKARGGGIMIQDQASSVVFGMPGAIFSAGLYDKMGNLEAIKRILEKLGKSSVFQNAAA